MNESILHIVDRIKVVKDLILKIESNNGSKVHILHAETGVGKSAVTTKLIQELSDNIECFCIRTNPLNTTQLPPNSIINLIFNNFQSKYYSTPYSFEKFNLKDEAKNLLFENEAIENNNANLLTYLLLWIKKSTSKLLYAKSDKTITKIMTGDSIEVLFKKISYIRHIFSTKDFVMIIDNMQSFDYESLHFLQNFIGFYQNRSHYFIFEYTDSEKSIDNVDKISSWFTCRDIKVEDTLIQKIESQYIVDIVNNNFLKKSQSYEFNKDLVCFYSSLKSGNIREVIDYSINYDTKSDFNNITQTQKAIRSLDSKPYSLMCLITYFNGKLNIDILKNLIDEKDKSALQNLINVLTDKKLVVVTGIGCMKSLEIAHASIIDALEVDKEIDSSPFVAWESILTTYCEENIDLQNEYIVDNLYSLLLHLYKIHSPKKIGHIFTHLVENIFVKISISDAWNCIDAFIDATIDEMEHNLDLYYKIFDICFRLELYEKLYSKVHEKLNSILEVGTNKEIYLYKMMYLSALDKHIENIAIYEQLNVGLNDNRFKLNIMLIVLSSYRSLGNKKKCLELHNELKNKKFIKYNEYAYRYRLVDMYLSRRASLKYLRKSIKKFSKQKNEIQAGKSLITYAHLLGGLGKISKAVKAIQLAADKLSSQIIGKHMLLVNQSVLQLLSGDYSEQVYAQLDFAEVTAIVPFDKLAIIVNKLIWCYENDRFDLVNILECKMKELIILEPDKHIHALIYYNFYAIYKKMLNEEMSNYYFDLTKMHMPYCEPVSARLNNKPTKETRFIIKKPWHVCYLAYWTYDIMY